MRRYLHLLNGPNTVGNSMIAWVLFVLVLILFLVYPVFGSRFIASNLTLFALYLPVALGLSLLALHGTECRNEHIAMGLGSEEEI